MFKKKTLVWGIEPSSSPARFSWSHPLVPEGQRASQLPRHPCSHASHTHSHKSFYFGSRSDRCFIYPGFPTHRVEFQVHQMQDIPFENALCWSSFGRSKVPYQTLKYLSLRRLHEWSEASGANGPPPSPPLTAVHGKHGFTAPSGVPSHFYHANGLNIDIREEGGVCFRGEDGVCFNKAPVWLDFCHISSRSVVL